MLLDGSVCNDIFSDMYRSHTTRVFRDEVREIKLWLWCEHMNITHNPSIIKLIREQSILFLVVHPAYYSISSALAHSALQISM